MLRGHISIPILAKLIYASFFVRFAITYMCSMKCIVVIMTRLVETFCYKALVVGVSWSRLNEAILAGTHDRWFSRAKMDTTVFLLYIAGTRGGLNVICVLS